MIQQLNLWQGRGGDEHANLRQMQLNPKLPKEQSRNTIKFKGVKRLKPNAAKSKTASTAPNPQTRQTDAPESNSKFTKSSCLLSTLLLPTAPNSSSIKLIN